MSFSRISLFLGCLGLASAAPAIGAEAVGKLALVRGDVTLDGAPAKSGAIVYSSSKIKTGNGKAALLLAGISVIQLGFDSELDVKSAIASKEKGKPTEAEVDLKQGKIRALVQNRPTPKKFTIRARTVTMGVRGTEVLVSNPPNPQTPPTFATIEGLAELSSSDGKSAATPLAANQSSSGGGETRTMTSGEARELASEVSAPRAETLTVAEAGQGEENAVGRASADVLDSFSYLDVKLDPLADGNALGFSVKFEPTSEKI